MSAVLFDEKAIDILFDIEKKRFHKEYTIANTREDIKNLHEQHININAWSYYVYGIKIRSEII